VSETAATNEDFEALLQFLKRQRGFDFTGYKRSSLERRVRKRMEAIQCPAFAEYLDYLQVHPQEYAELFNAILINVTSFFRDPAAWSYIDEHVVPELVERSSRGLRIWSAGCASGEEAYSIAMLLVRAMGEANFRDRVKLYATDVDEEALDTARHAVYPPRALEDAPQDLVDLCFERSDHHLAFRKDLRRSAIFGRNDLVQDAPISRIDLLLCRNTLMYFTAETQARILGRMNFALQDTGFLFLGKSEMLLTHGDLFVPRDLKCRVFTKVPRPTLRDHLAFVTNGDAEPDPPDAFRDAAFDLAPVPQLVVGSDGALTMANHAARRLFGISRRDFGRPLQDIEASYRPVELRSAIERAAAERGRIDLGTVPYRPSAGANPMSLDVSVTAILAGDGEVLGTAVTFTDVTRDEALRDELERSKRELEVAYEELQSTVEELETTNEELQSTNEELETTNEELQSTNEELETMNEELQSTNEELETTNEELQSTNEELETMNEELQSTNEELETINDELRERTTELNGVNAALDTILTSLDVGIAVVDTEQVVRLWNANSDDLWGLRDEEAVGRHLLSLDIGLPVHELRDPLRDALRGEEPAPIVVSAINRRGRTFSCRLSCIPLRAGAGDLIGAIVLMGDGDGDGAAVIPKA
jgi:two-component system, chemotaxis family, CheB/CheR fusion protein